MSQVSRDPDELLPQTRHKLESVKSIMRWLKAPVFIVETFRPEERQLHLYEQGRTRPGPKVTWTKYGWHQTRRSFDLAFRDPDPNDDHVPGAWDDDHPWKLLGEVAESVGLKWGVTRNGKRSDLGHFEDRGGLTLAEARALLKAEEEIA